MSTARVVPNLVSTAGLLGLYPAIKERTLRRWIQNATPRRVNDSGDERELPGNGLAAALIRKGRVLLIDADRFEVWLRDGQASD